jgi:hypothetical protein
MVSSTTANKGDRTEKLGITLPISLLQKIDNKRGDIPRSTYIRRAIESYLKWERDEFMFSFLKRHKPQDQFYEPEQQLTIRELALRVFSKIEGLDDIKEMMFRALESSDRCHTLLTGPPASSKSLFMLETEKFLLHKVYFAECAAASKAGLQRFIAENPHKRNHHNRWDWQNADERSGGFTEYDGKRCFY